MDIYINILNHLNCKDKDNFSIIIYKPFDEPVKSLRNIQMSENEFNDYLELEILNSITPSFKNINLLDIRYIYSRSENAIIFIDDIDRKKDIFTIEDSNTNDMFSLFHKTSLNFRNKIQFFRCFKNDLVSKILIDLLDFKWKISNNDFPLIMGLRGIPFKNKFFSYVIKGNNKRNIYEYKKDSHTDKNNNDNNISNKKYILDNLINSLIKNKYEKNPKIKFSFSIKEEKKENKENLNNIPIYNSKEKKKNDTSIDIDFDANLNNKIINFNLIDLENELDKIENKNYIFIIYTYEKKLLEEVNLKIKLK